MKLLFPVLISFVAGLMVPGERAGQFLAIPANSIVAMTKAGGSILTKAIVIENNSPHVEERGICHSDWDSVPIERCAALYHCCSGYDDIIPLSFASINGEIDQTAVGINSDVDYPRNTTGWQISNIFDSDRCDSKMIGMPHANNADWFNTKISPLEQPGIACLSARESSDNFQLTFASTIQTDSGNPQRSGRDGEYQSEQGYWVARSPLPKGFAFVTLLAGLLGGLLGGLVTFLLLFFGRRV
jgi:hypothetical protein